jgi:hypothetical protein
MRQPRMTAGLGIAGSQDIISGAETRFRLSRDFVNGCRTGDPGGHEYDMSVKFFPCRVYINSCRHDTLGRVITCPLLSSHNMFGVLLVVRG